MLFLGVFANVSAQRVEVGGAFGPDSAKKGQTVSGAIAFIIPNGVHVNSNRPLSKLAIPTTIRLSGAGVKIGAVRFPAGKILKFSFSDEKIAVFEGKTIVRFSVTIPPTFKGNVVTVKATVRYQACTDEICYPPKNEVVTMTIPVN